MKNEEQCQMVAEVHMVKNRASGQGKKGRVRIKEPCQNASYQTKFLKDLCESKGQESLLRSKSESISHQAWHKFLQLMWK